MVNFSNFIFFCWLLGVGNSWKWLVIPSLILPTMSCGMSKATHTINVSDGCLNYSFTNCTGHSQTYSTVTMFVSLSFLSASSQCGIRFLSAIIHIQIPWVSCCYGRSEFISSTQCKLHVKVYISKTHSYHAEWYGLPVNIMLIVVSLSNLP